MDELLELIEAMAGDESIPAEAVDSLRTAFELARSGNETAANTAAAEARDAMAAVVAAHAAEIESIRNERYEDMANGDDDHEETAVEVEELDFDNYWKEED